MATPILDRIKAAIKAAVEASGNDNDKIGLGDEAGSPINVEGAGIFDRGLTWLFDRTGVKGAQDYILEAVAKDMGDRAIAFAHISTNSAGNPPTLTTGVGITSPTKDEVNDRITVTLDPAYTSGSYYVSGRVFGQPYIDVATSTAAAAFTMEFHNLTTAARADINSLNVMLLVIGKVGG